MATASLLALEPLVMKELFDTLLAAPELGEAWRPFALLISLLVAHQLLAALLDYGTWRVRLGVNFGLLEATVDRLHSLPLSYHREESVGATMTKVERGVTGCMTAFSDVVVQLLPSLVYLCVSVFVMLRLEWRLAVAVLLFAPLPAAVGALAAREQLQREKSLLERWTRVFARFNEVLSGILVVKSFVMEEDEKRRFLSGVEDANGVVLRGVATDARTTALKNAIMAAARLVALGVGGVLVMRQSISLGTLIAFVGYLGGLFHPVQTLTGLYQTFRRGTASLECVLSILGARDSLGDAPHARELKDVRGEIEFRDVSFAYRPGVRVLKHVNLSVRPGEMVALVGPSGAGKTSLTALLQRLYDPTAGAVLIDGQDLRDLKQRSIRFQIGVVQQDGTLFSDSVRDNIAFGRPNATPLEIEDAARAANAHEFIMALPQGYDTPIGERGCKLSGGERQRISIARALLKNAPILVLDEATSALDAETEEQVKEALSRLTRGRTTLVIAHRLSTVTAAHRIAVFRDGAISEIGTHRELMTTGGYYASLVAKQVRGLIAEAA